MWAKCGQVVGDTVYNMDVMYSSSMACPHVSKNRPHILIENIHYHAHIHVVALL
jgi:hypothetical protein